MFENLSKIKIPENRYRREFDPKRLEELKDSIKRIGLLAPIVVEASGNDYILRAGERRLRVVTALAAEEFAISHGGIEVPLGQVPIVDYESLTELQRLEVEVEENVVRADFAWQERTSALAALHKLRSAQNPGQTIKETASEVLGKPAQGSQQQVVSDALIVARHLDDPDVAKAKDQKEALKIIGKKAEAAQRARLAVNFDPSKVQHKLILGEALEELRKLPGDSFDCILSDPPYGVDADNFGSMSDAGHEYEDSYKYWQGFMSEVGDELFRVAKPQAHLYLFCDLRRFTELQTLMVLSNWICFPVPLIWYKGTGMLPFPETGPRRTYECILYAWKGGKRVNSIRNDVILNIPAVRTLKHGAQKPVALYQDLLSRSTVAGNRVLDFCGGTGPILVAANIMKLEATYIERDKKFYDIAVSRATLQEADDGVAEGGELDDIPF